MKYLLPVCLAALLGSATIPQPVSPVTVPPQPILAKVEVPTRRGSVIPRYNFPAASRGDRWGLDTRRAKVGWKRYGKLIKTVSAKEGIDPHVLGAYVWVESSFNPKQDYRRGKMRAMGLGSVQAQDYPQYTPKQLQDPHLNLTLTAREFKRKWKKHDMAATVMDVWYPSWRKHGKKIPVIGESRTYVQAIANRYHVLVRLDGR